MFETDVPAPSVLIMTLITLLSFLALVDIVRRMATETIHGKFFCINLSSVTG
jgi:hypothetical protein